jgi:hypothetical protein
MEAATKQLHIDRVRYELREAGITVYGLLKSESRFLPHIIHPGEHIHAVIYGQHDSASAMLIATDKRIIYLDKKPMAVFIDEVTYDVVSGIEMDVHTIFATITLHTAVANYQFRYVNIRCASKFARFIEEQKIKKFFEQKEQSEERREIAPRAKEFLQSVMPNLAGYYWVPQEDKEKKNIYTG